MVIFQPPPSFLFHDPTLTLFLPSLSPLSNKYPTPLAYAYAPFLLPLANIVVEQMKVRKRKDFPSPLFFKRIDNSCRSDQRMSIISTSITANTMFFGLPWLPLPAATGSAFLLIVDFIVRCHFRWPRGRDCDALVIAASAVDEFLPRNLVTVTAEY